MGAKSRRKGARGELEVAKMFQQHGWATAHRRSTGEESQERQGVDLKGTEPWCVQVNLSDRPNPHKKYGEAAAAAGTLWPVAFTRKTNGKWLVTMDAERFFLLAGYP